MSEQETFDISYAAPRRVREVVQIDETVSHIDILLPHSEESYVDGMRWVNALRKVLRVHRIDERSIILSDLSSLEGDHFYQAPSSGAEETMPAMVMDIFDSETAVYGRDYNPAGLEILSDRLISREHLKITPRLGEAGLMLAFTDEISTNGSDLVVVRHRVAAPDSLFAT